MALLALLAELIYGEENAEQYFDSAVRWVIILIVLVFDPLAVLLLIAANISYMNQPPKIEKRLTENLKQSIINL